MSNWHCAGARVLAWPAAAIFALFICGGGESESAPGTTKGDATNGAAVFVRQCALCHTITKDGPDRFGPNLFGVTNRKAASAPAYTYSDVFRKTANWTWSAESIASFIRAPGMMIPGSRMGVFQGVADKDLDDVVAYLAQQK
jgi:cytochrome c